MPGLFREGNDTRFASMIFVLAVSLTSGLRTFGEIPLRGTVIVGTPTALPVDAVPGQSVTFTVTASTTALGTPLEFSWDFGDTVTTLFAVGTSPNSVNHIYAAIGHYTVTVAVREFGNPPSLVTSTLKFTVHRPLSTAKPQASSSIILDSTNGKIWVANADQDTVSSMSLGGSLLTSFTVGKNPRTLAQAADKTIWVVSQQNPSISILDPLSGALLHVIPLPHGSLPYGICMTPDGSAAYVSFQGSGGVAEGAAGDLAQRVDVGGEGVQIGVPSGVGGPHRGIGSSGEPRSRKTEEDVVLEVLDLVEVRRPVGVAVLDAGAVAAALLHHRVPEAFTAVGEVEDPHVRPAVQVAAGAADIAVQAHAGIAGVVDLNNQILLWTAEDDKEDASATLVTLTVTGSTDFIVFYDSHATTLPTWLSTFVATAAGNVAITPGTAGTGLLMKAYKKTFPAGPVVLGGAQQGGPTGAPRNHFAILKPAVKTFEEGPMSQLEWVHDRDADGDGLHDDFEAINTPLSPWVFNSNVATLPDEDKILSGTQTAFQAQVIAETPLRPAAEEAAAAGSWVWSTSCRCGSCGLGGGAGPDCRVLLQG